ncbi:MAG TPA: gluconate 2-dehydrogenase subunit 3 family protein, partial [Sulfurimonas sp.]|nr:gluconate 2-dehydrogenase subunit 3 family protein [Sulfurimonas sp.]
GSSFIVAAGSFYLINKNTEELAFYANEIQVLLHTAYHIFPSSDIGVGAKDLHIASYLAFVLQDKRIIKEDKDYFLKGAYWLEESAFETYNKSFLNLNYDEKEALLKEVTQDRWARTFVYTCLGYIFEALLSSPIYGSNHNEIGWKWLEHKPGFPQPQTKEEINYEV